MSNLSVSVRSLMIPMKHDPFLLPNASLAEIVAYSAPGPLENSPEWLLGLLPWRGLDIPLVSFEVMHGEPMAEVSGHERIAIFNAPGGDSRLPFFAILVQGIPHLIMANQSVVTALAEQEAEEGVLAHVLIEAEPAIIPDLDRIESILLSEKTLLA